MDSIKGADLTRVWKNLSVSTSLLSVLGLVNLGSVPVLTPSVSSRVTGKNPAP